MSKLEVDLKPYICMENTEQNRKKIAKTISEGFSRVIAETLQKDTDWNNLKFELLWYEEDTNNF